MAMCDPMLAQHHDLWRNELPNIEDADKLQFAFTVLQRGRNTVSDAARASREEMLRMSGRVEGMINTCMSLLQTIEKKLTHFKAQQERAAQKDEMDTMLEQHHEKQNASKGNGIAETKKAPAKKKKAPKKQTKAASKVRK